MAKQSNTKQAVKQSAKFKANNCKTRNVSKALVKLGRRERKELGPLNDMTMFKALMKKIEHENMLKRKKLAAQKGKKQGQSEDE